jgi:hypothetical protein
MLQVMGGRNWKKHKTEWRGKTKKNQTRLIKKRRMNFVDEKIEIKFTAWEDTGCIKNQIKIKIIYFPSTNTIHAFKDKYRIKTIH